MDPEILFRRHSDAADAFEEGYYRWERRGAVPLPVRVWFGPPICPDTGEELDRSHRWQVTVDGREVGQPGAPLLEWFWPKCKAVPVDKAEHDYLIAMAAHARRHDPYSPFGQVNGKIDLLSATIPTPGD